MGRAKAKPRSNTVARITCGAAHTDVARYATREDRHFIAKTGSSQQPLAEFHLGGAEDALLACVIDGHRGDAAAIEVARALPGHLAAALATEPDASLAMRAAFVRCERDVVAATETSGACCVAAAIDAAGLLTVAWVGDCRAVVATAAASRQLTRDHTPDRDRERIEAAGGFAIDDGGVWRVGVEPGEARGESDEGPRPKRRKVELLACARAFGDNDFAAVVSAIPDVASHELGPDSVVLLASDGVHEALPEALAVGALRSAFADGGDAADAARAVVAAAKAAGSTDDITAVVLRCHA